MVHVYNTSGLAKSFEGLVITNEIQSYLNSNPTYKYQISTFTQFPPPHMIFEFGSLVTRSLDELVALGFVNPDQNPYPDQPYWVYNRETERWVEDTELKSTYKKDLCKDGAKERIAKYDWVVDEATSPGLLNRDDFIAYRSLLRDLIINPVENPTWPEIPQEEWE